MNTKLVLHRTVKFCRRNFGYLTLALMMLGLMILVQQSPQQTLYSALLNSAPHALPELPEPIIKNIRPQQADKNNGIYAIIELKFSAKADAPKIEYVIFNDNRSASTYLHHYVNLTQTTQTSLDLPVHVANGSCATSPSGGSCGSRSGNIAIFSFANQVDNAAAMVNGALQHLNKLRQRLGASLPEYKQPPLQSSPLPKPRTGGLV